MSFAWSGSKLDCWGVTVLKVLFLLNLKLGTNGGVSKVRYNDMVSKSSSIIRLIGKLIIV
jgi:hypothetical protein